MMEQLFKKGESFKKLIIWRWLNISAFVDFLSGLFCSNFPHSTHFKIYCLLYDYIFNQFFTYIIILINLIYSNWTIYN